MMDHMGGPPDMGYNGRRGYGHKDQGFLSKLFGGRRDAPPRNDWGGGPPMDMHMGYGNRYPRDHGRRDFPPMGYEDRPRARDFSPGRAWMANRGMDGPRGRERDLGDFDDLEDMLPPRRRDPMDDLDLMMSRRDPGRPHMDLRSVPERGRREYRGRTTRPLSADGRVEFQNNNLGWSNNRANQGPFQQPRIKVEVRDELPKYKFNSPHHQFHVKHKYDSYEMEKNKNRMRREEDDFDDFDDRDRYDDRGRYDDRDRYEDRYDDRRDDRRRSKGGRDGPREGRGRRRDDDSEYDDENPYHHLPSHIPKDDYDNAMKRNLHAWSQWRTGLNDRGIKDTRDVRRLHDGRRH